MPEPLTIALGGVAIALVLLLASVARYYRLRNAIDETAAAVTVQRQRLEELLAALERARLGGSEAEPDPDGSGVPPTSSWERVIEAEDSLAAVHRLHAAQVRAWNGAADAPLWRALRPLTGWQPIAEPPDEGRPSTTRRGEAA